MTYRLSLAVDANICLEIEQDDLRELISEFERMGGDSAWLVNAAKASVARSLHGEAVGNVVRSMTGSVIEDADDTATQRSASGRGATNGRGASRATERDDAGTTRTARRSDDSPADPWASDRDDYPGEAAVARRTLTSSKPTDSDPWGEDTHDEPQGRQRTTQSHTRSHPDDGATGITTTRDKFEREWTIGLPEAPECDCPAPAARVKAKSQAGKWYTTWKCAKGAGSDYRDKCSFSEFPD